MKLTDEQLLEELRASGHTEAATALEQKVNAAGAASAAAGGGEPGQPAPVNDQRPGAARMARAYGERAQARGDQ